MRTTGTVKWFNDKKGYGFITANGGVGDVFVHYRSIQGDGYKTLNDGDLVEFEVVNGPKGLAAKDVTVTQRNPSASGAAYRPDHARP